MRPKKQLSGCLSPDVQPPPQKFPVIGFVQAGPVLLYDDLPELPSLSGGYMACNFT